VDEAQKYLDRIAKDIRGKQKSSTSKWIVILLSVSDIVTYNRNKPFQFYIIFNYSDCIYPFILIIIPPQTKFEGVYRSELVGRSVCRSVGFFVSGW
jgi:hypothetical protein